MIDIHVHLADARCLSPGFVAGIAESILDDDRVERAVRLYLMDRHGKRLLSQMEAHGITKSILLIADFGPALGEPELSIEEVHEHHAAVARASGGRLAFFAGFDPSRGPAALDIVRRWTAVPGCEGVKLYPPCGFELDDERLLPLWQHCNDNGIPVLTHSGPSLPSLGRAQRYPHSLEEVVRRFPEVRIALAHGMVWDLEGTIRLLQQHPANLYADISSFHQLSEHELELMLEGCTKVPDQVLFGSDAPLFDFSGNLGARIEELRGHLTPAQQAGLFELNARQFLHGTNA
ncbi:amidohydrolase family protein [Streptomyces phaeoluteigriseus]|uniref:Amidohydrolase family protein n=1 Tax=Streptomyces phaeoluteigriseus TaxID=114686 RepID=A0ABY4ZBQ2_9ACTN|nr:amidohydrolase family protein [Streptomyces phaeoluteigriseus]USQ86254.1 amidohydrolase family protein [Streptomyces phaeoluteigriseus]